MADNCGRPGLPGHAALAEGGAGGEPRRGGPESISSAESGIDPEDQALLADSVGLALVVVLERLARAERVAFVLHDMFAMPFDENSGFDYG
jgi:hypothetical protein